MRNGYFQLVCGASGTGLKIFAPIDGGSPVNIKELMEYLVRYGIMYDTPSLNKAVQEAMTSPNGESQVLLNANPSMEVRENYMLHVSQDRMLATARFYPPSVNGERPESAVPGPAVLRGMLCSFGRHRHCTKPACCRENPNRSDRAVQLFYRRAHSKP